ncbi:metallophosphoesterase family protein [bacterium]|nr:metallophosphoesterase family protein [bacterium]
MAATTKNMKIIIFSDVHSNWEALQSFLSAIEDYPDARIYSLGDIVGYGANPRECLAEVRRIAHVSLTGNHDHAAIGLTDITYFNPYAREAVLWTASHLDMSDRDYISSLPVYKRFSDKIFLVHSTPAHPERWNYILDKTDAEKNFPFFTEPLCFIGHSHVPMVVEYDPYAGNACYRDEEGVIRLKEGCRYIVNVGSIGQPRDGDWRACFSIYDGQEQTIEFKRLEYDLATAQEKILHAGLPDFLAERLRHGR